jgi:phosphoglucomutase
MANKKLKVKDNPGLERDTATKAIINTNNDAYLSRRIQIKAYENKQKLDMQQSKDIDNLKSDVAEIKKMLQKLIGGK